jgi:hypothetical protein
LRATGAGFRAADVGDKERLRAAIDGSLVVIHAAGPFQGRDYTVAQVCVDAGAHYLDLADARDFVAGIGALHQQAGARGVFVCSGASSAPAVTSAMADELARDFSQVDEMHVALSPGNQNPRGDSTVAAVLSYLGRPIRVWQASGWSERSGWGDSQVFEFPPKVGRRRVYNCDVPDLELFPTRYGAGTVRFQAGLELGVLNQLVSFSGILARHGRVNLVNHAGFFRRVSRLFYRFGSKNGSLAVWMRGTDANGARIERKIAIVTDDDGPATPCSAAIVLARRIITAGPPLHGAVPCVGLLNLGELLAHLQPLGIWCCRGDERGWSSRSRL